MHVVGQGGIAAVFQDNFFSMYGRTGKISKLFTKKELPVFGPQVFAVHNFNIVSIKNCKIIRPLGSENFEFGIHVSRK